MLLFSKEWRAMGEGKEVMRGKARRLVESGA
jgi:hypothetical protein